MCRELQQQEEESIQEETVTVMVSEDHIKIGDPLIEGDILTEVGDPLTEENTGGSHLNHTAVKPDSCLAQIFFLQNLVSFFLYNLM